MLHPQLRELWDKDEFLKEYRNDPVVRVQPTEPSRTIGEAMIQTFTRFGIKFLPLVSKQYCDLACSLDILFLRRDDPGNLIKSGGDIDNRIKVLLDALRVPQDAEEVSGFTPTADQIPLYCLLEDDRLVTGINITTDRLLTAVPEGGHENDVHLIIKVQTQLLRVTIANLSFLR
jgi:hypothetical protein